MIDQGDDGSSDVRSLSNRDTFESLRISHLLLFNIGLEGVLTRVEINTSGTIFTKNVQLLGFAEDIDIKARKFETMAETRNEARRCGSGINVSKTKFMMIKGCREEFPRPSSLIFIDGDEIETAEEFVYLGSLMTADSDTSRENQRRIVAGNRAYYFELLHTKLTIYKTLIRPVVFNGHEAWTLHAEDRRVGVFERKVLRTIYGGVQMEDGTCRRRMNHELHQLLREPIIVHTAEIGRLRRTGHVIRMSDSNPTKMILESLPSGTRRDAQRARWVDQVKDDLRTFRRVRN